MKIERLHVDRPIVVEGKYDKIKLSSLVDAAIIATDGFAIFKDREKMQMLRQLAEKNGLILLTDSDVAGFKIRSYIANAVGTEKVTHVYIPDVYGKERRKIAPSKEGKLGVEGISAILLREAFEKAGVLCKKKESFENTRQITKRELFEAGLTGGPDSRRLRQKLYRKLSLPEHLSANSLLGVLNSMYSYEEAVAVLYSLQQDKE